MATVKQRFKKDTTSLKINLFVLIGLVLVGIVAGFLLSDSGITDLAFFEKEQTGLESMNCSELLETTQEFMDDLNVWRNDAQSCAKQLWACGLQLRQYAAAE